LIFIENLIAMTRIIHFFKKASYLRLLFILNASMFIVSVLSAQHTKVLQKINDQNMISLYSAGSHQATIPLTFQQKEDANSTFSSKYQKEVLPIYNWDLKFTASGKVFKDISFAGSQVGYIVTELGSVYKTENGGENWTSVMNLGFPYYWYGVEALTPDTVIIAGFNNQAPITQGVVRWTFDGGSTWGGDINLGIPVSAVGWLDRVHFFNSDTGIVINSFSGGCWLTLNGGKDSSSWNYVTINTDLAWFSGNIDAQPGGNVFATGFHLAHSSDFGFNWTSGPCADIVFDGGVDFLDNNEMYGWTGGGQISSPVSGWVCRTTDAGMSWSARLKTFDYPIRGVYFLDELNGWAIGGNVYGEAGGIWSTGDGGTTWNPDVNTSAEMFSMEFVPVSADSMDIWCVGSTGGGTGFTGKLFKTRIGYFYTGLEPFSARFNDGFILNQNFQNPFDKLTTISYTLPVSCFVSLKVFDIMGKEVINLINESEPAGNKSFQFECEGIPSGIYYYQLRAGSFSATRILNKIR
jgi:photosystem II stability/assembly factor-like uncharacterized protein